MTDNKARRVRLWSDSHPYEGHYDDPNGTHHLAHVDHFEVVKKEVWERVKQSLMAITQLEVVLTYDQIREAWPLPVTEPDEPCPDCNGEGFKIGGGDE